jgi:hypothetical protein
VKEIDQALEMARNHVQAAMPYVHVEQARIFQYHPESGRLYVEVDVTHNDPDQGAAMVLCRISYNAAGELAATRVDIVEREEGQPYSPTPADEAIMAGLLTVQVVGAIQQAYVDKKIIDLETYNTLYAAAKRADAQVQKVSKLLEHEKDSQP